MRNDPVTAREACSKTYNCMFDKKKIKKSLENKPIIMGENWFVTVTEIKAPDFDVFIRRASDDHITVLKKTSKEWNWMKLNEMSARLQFIFVCNLEQFVNEYSNRDKKQGKKGEHYHRKLAKSNHRLTIRIKARKILPKICPYITQATCDRKGIGRTEKEATIFKR